MKPQLSYSLAALTGVLLVVIHPDPNLVELAPVALVPILVASANEASWRQRFLMGWLAGILQWGGMCYWIRDTLAVHGGMGGAVALLMFVLFSLAKGLHLALFSTLAGPMFGFRWATPFAALLWVGLERTHANLGFVWLPIGNAALEMALPMRLAPFTGVYGVSFVFALLSATLAGWWMRRDRLQFAFCAPLLLLWLLPELPVFEAGKLSAVTVQPNVPEDIRFSDEQLHEVYGQIAKRTLAMSMEPRRGKASLLIWPEMPTSLYYERDAAFREMTGSLARLARAPFLFGTVRFAPNGEPFNSAQMLDATGQPQGVYDKMNLVPFGEYVPPIFNLAVEKVSAEAGTFQPGQQIRIFPTETARLGPLICYESAFPHHVTKITAAGAEVLVNLTNDGYFGKSAARGQHLKLARMRAAENRRWLLRPTNDGITAAIDPAGRVTDILAPYKAVTGRLNYNAVKEQTFYTQFGDVFAWSALGLSLIPLLALWREERLYS
jgi:apolipoprotein N-acyltransferase